MTSRSVRRNGAPVTAKQAMKPAPDGPPPTIAQRPLPRRPILLSIGGALLLVWLLVLGWLAWRG